MRGGCPRVGSCNCTCATHARNMGTRCRLHKSTLVCWLHKIHCIIDNHMHVPGNVAAFEGGPRSHERAHRRHDFEAQHGALQASAELGVEVVAAVLLKVLLHEIKVALHRFRPCLSSLGVPQVARVAGFVDEGLVLGGQLEARWLFDWLRSSSVGFCSGGCGGCGTSWPAQQMAIGRAGHGR